MAKAPNNSTKKTKSRLHDSKGQAAHRQWAREHLAHASKATEKTIEKKTDDTMKQPRNLNEARTRIAELEAKAVKPSPNPIPPSEVAALAKPAVKPSAADVKNFVASNPGALESLESIQSEINSLGTPEARIKSLAAHSQSYLDQAAKARQAKDYAAETKILRERQRLEVRRAYELHAADPATQKAFFRQIPDI